MKNYITRSVFLIIIILPLSVSVLFGQTVGNPVKISESGVFSVGLESGYLISDLGEIDNTSFRALSRFEYSAANNFSINLYAGGSQYNIKYSVADNLEDFIGSFEFAYGIGLKANLWQLPGTVFKIFTGCTYLRYQSLGNVTSISDPDIVDLDFHFLLSEMWFFLGTIIPLDRLDFYGGIDLKRFKRVDRYSKEEFIPDISDNIFVGIDYRLPDRYFLNFQARFLSDVSFMVGISQSSKPVK